MRSWALDQLRQLEYEVAQLGIRIEGFRELRRTGMEPVERSAGGNHKRWRTPMPEPLLQENVPERSLRDVYYVLFRHKWKMILVFFFVVVAATVYTLRLPEIYQSEAKLLIRVGQETVLDRTGSDGLITLARTSERSQINAEIEILKSRELIEKVVDAIGPKAFLKRPDTLSAAQDTTGETERKIRSEVVRGIIKNLDIRSQRSSNIISISYQTQSPKLAQEVISRFIEFYLEKHLVVHRSPGSYDFFARQMERARAQLAQTQEELQNLKHETGIASLDEQRSIILGRIGALHEEIEQTEVALAVSRAKLQLIQERLAALPDTLVMSRTLQTRKFLGREDTTGTTVTWGINTAYQDMQSALLAEETTFSSLQAKVQTLEEQLAIAQGKLKTLNDNTVRFVELQREIDIQEAKYRKYAENLEQTRVDKTFETEKISNISVVQPATYPVEPLPRDRRKKLAMGLFLGIFGGIGLAFVSEFMDHSLKRPEDVEAKLHLPTLAAIPRLKKFPLQIGIASPRLTSTTKKGENAPTAASELVPLDVPSEVGEPYEYQSLPERLLLSGEGSEELPCVLALTSCYSGEGVSTVAAHFAITLAGHSDGRVLFVDANLGRPSAHRIFGVNRSPGLTDFLVDDQGYRAIIQSSPVRNLDVVSSGQRNTTFSQRSELKVLDDLLSRWRKEYRFVVLDTPAVRGDIFSILLASMVDGVILVVEAERVRWQVVQRVKERLVRAKANVLGVFLNKRRLYIPEWLYQRL